MAQSAQVRCLTRAWPTDWAWMEQVDIDIVKLYQKELVTPDLLHIGDMVFDELNSTIEHVKMVAALAHPTHASLPVQTPCCSLLLHSIIPHDNNGKGTQLENRAMRAALSERAAVGACCCGCGCARGACFSRCTRQLVGASQ